MTQAQPKVRLYVPEEFRAGHHLSLNEKQSHYLMQVMRLAAGDMVAVFNGREGEWLACIESMKKKSVALSLQQQLQAQRESPDIWLAFAPIKNKSDIVVEKATELGVSALIAVYTRYSVVKSINHEKLVAHAIEAAEQCERHDVPTLEERKDVAALLDAWPKDRPLLWADESGGGHPLKELLPSLPPGKYGLLIGPEGGFSPDEQKMLKSTIFVKTFCLGPRILRADTAAIAALACIQSWLGDWDKLPHFTPSREGSA